MPRGTVSIEQLPQPIFFKFSDPLAISADVQLHKLITIKHIWCRAFSEYIVTFFNWVRNPDCGRGVK